MSNTQDDKLADLLSMFAVEESMVVDTPFSASPMPDISVLRVNCRNGDSFYLYSEDFVTDLQHVRNNLEEVTTGLLKGALVPAKKSFEYSGWVGKQFITRDQKGNYFDEELAKYIVADGVDMVLLFKIEE